MCLGTFWVRRKLKWILNYIRNLSDFKNYSPTVVCLITLLILFIFYLCLTTSFCSALSKFYHLYKQAN